MRTGFSRGRTARSAPATDEAALDVEPDGCLRWAPSVPPRPAVDGDHLAGSLLEGRDAQRSAGGRQRVAALPCNLAVGERPLAGFGERHELRAALMPASSISSCRCFRDLRTPSPRPRAGPRRCRALCGGQLLIVHSAWTTSRVAGPSTKRRPALGPTVLGWDGQRHTVARSGSGRRTSR